MDTFDVSEYSDSSRKILKEVVEEIREQFLVGGCVRQFWFYSTRVSNEKLTDPIIQKWLDVLSRKGVLHYYKPSYTELERDIAFNVGYIENGYNWAPEMRTQLILNSSPHVAPSFALDVYDTDLDKLISLISKNRIWDKFYKDDMDRFYYDNNLLDGINCSPIRKAVLSEFLLADKQTVLAKRLTEIVSDDDDDEKRNRIISEIKKELRSINHSVDITSVKSGHKAYSYTLVV